MARIPPRRDSRDLRAMVIATRVRRDLAIVVIALEGVHRDLAISRIVLEGTGQDLTITEIVLRLVGTRVLIRRLWVYVRLKQAHVKGRMKSHPTGDVQAIVQIANALLDREWADPARH
jgi:hypothetical protein